MNIDRDEAARANVLVWQRLLEGVPGASVQREGGVLGVMTGIGLQGFNGVWGERQDVDPGVVAAFLDKLGEAGVPHCMQLRPGWPAKVDEVARARGLSRVTGEPLMVLQDDRHLGDALEAGGLSLRQLLPEEGAVHAHVAALGGVVGKEEPYRAMTRPEVLRTDGLRCYVGDVAGEAVTTAISMTTGDCVGIFSVATLPDHRRRGYAAAVTARAVRDGFDAGARWAWLSASDAGYRVYRSLGFVTLERLDFWERPRR